MSLTVSILFLNHLTQYILSMAPFDLTDGNVSAADKEGDDNVNETDYTLKKGMSGE